MLKIKYRKNEKFAIIPVPISTAPIYEHNVITELVYQAIEEYVTELNAYGHNEEVTVDIVEMNIDLKNKTAYACVAFV